MNFFSQDLLCTLNVVTSHPFVLLLFRSTLLIKPVSNQMSVREYVRTYVRTYVYVLTCVRPSVHKTLF